MTIANVITLGRLVLGIPIAFLIVSTGGKPSLGVLVLFLIGGASDGLDGYFARRRNEITQLGTMLDPVADKVFGTAIFAAFVYVGSLPAWLFGVLVSKELLLLLGGAFLLRGRGRTLSARPLGKAATVILFVGFGFLLIGLSPIGIGLSVLGVALSLAAGVDYAIQVMRGRNNSGKGGDD